MGCHYFAHYTVKIRPDAVEALQAEIDAEELLKRYFSIQDGVLSCKACDEMGYSTATLIEDFTKGPVSDAAAESVLVEECCDGDETHYGIGPEADKALSAYRLDEIKELAGDLTADDRLVLFNELGWTDSPS